MLRTGSMMIVAVLAGLAAGGSALAQIRDRYDNSVDMRAPLSRQQQRTMVTNAPRQQQPPTACNPALPTDIILGCTPQDRVSAPLQAVPCVPKGLQRNPDLGDLPNTCP